MGGVTCVTCKWKHEKSEYDSLVSLFPSPEIFSSFCYVPLNLPNQISRRLALCCHSLSFNRCSTNVRGASLIAQLVNHLPAMQETWVQFLGQEDPLEKKMATHSSILAWRIPRTEEPDRSTGSQESDMTLATKPLPGREITHFGY